MNKIQFREGVEGPVRVLNTEKYERTFEGPGPFECDEDEWAHLQTVMTTLFETQQLGSVTGDNTKATARPVNVAKPVPVFELVPEKPKSARREQAKAINQTKATEGK